MAESSWRYRARGKTPGETANMLGCGGCLCTLVYFASAGIIGITSMAKLVFLLPPEMQTGIGASLGASQKEFVLSASKNPVLYIVAGVALIIFISMISSFFSKYMRMSATFAEGVEEGKKRDPSVPDPPIFKAAKFFSVLALCGSLTPIIFSVVSSNLKTISIKALSAIYAIDTVMLPVTIASVIVMYILFVVSGFSYKKTWPEKAGMVDEELAKAFGPGIRHEPRGQLMNAPMPYVATFVGDLKSSNDHIFGQYRGLDFEQADVVFEEPGQVYDSIREEWEYGWVTVFVGRFVIARIPKSVPSRVLVLNKVAYEAGKKAHGKTKRFTQFQEVALEDSHFNEYYRVLATSPHDAFYALTPQFIEHLKRMASLGYGKRSADTWIAVGFHGDMVHIALNGLRDAFETAASHSMSIDEMRGRIQADIRVVTDILDSLL